MKGEDVIDQDRPCPHEDFEAVVEVNRLCLEGTREVTAYNASVRVWCRQCTEKFRFIGTPAGVLADRPACSVDETELRAPIRPASSDPDFGMGIPGFSVRIGGERVTRPDLLRGMDTSDPDDHGVVWP